jgi:succinylarginine dihydrolase
VGLTEKEKLPEVGLAKPDRNPVRRLALSTHLPFKPRLERPLGSPAIRNAVGDQSLRPGQVLLETVASSRRNWCTNAMAILPSPTAAATRLTGL